MNGSKRGLRLCAFVAVLLSGLLAGTASDAGAWATITVNSLADPGEPSICSLRDAIIAANTQTVMNGCAAGNGHDTIQFSVTGTILLASTLPEITDSQLTINGPVAPGITIDGGNQVGVMQAASGAALSLKTLTIAHGFAGFPPPVGETLLAGGIVNEGKLTVTNSSLSGNSCVTGRTGAIDNEGL